MTMSVDVAATITRARLAQQDWARTDPAARGEMLRAAATSVRAQADTLAALVAEDMGKPIEDAKAEVLAGAGTLDEYAVLGPLHRGKTLQGAHLATDFMVAQPRGVVVALTPWNDPIAVACGLVGAALVTGNAVIHKPSERATNSGVMLGKLLTETHPADVLTTVVGDGELGAKLTENPHVALIAHVGSSATGQAIAAAAAATGAKTLLENGGNDALLIDQNVHPVWAAQQAATGAFANSGQICVAVERIYVHEAIAARFTKALVDAAAERGLTPLVDPRHRDHVHAQVVDAVDRGAQPLIGGALPAGAGAHYPATVLAECTPIMRVMSEETFGPVAPVRVVHDFAQGLLEAADGPYGLAATVLTGSMDHAQRAWRELPVGTVKINSVFGGAPGGAAEPRGCSGNGFGYGPELLDEMTRTKVVHLEAPII